MGDVPARLGCGRVPNGVPNCADRRWSSASRPAISPIAATGDDKGWISESVGLWFESMRTHQESPV